MITNVKNIDSIGILNIMPINVNTEGNLRANYALFDWNDLDRRREQNGYDDRDYYILSQSLTLKIEFEDCFLVCEINPGWITDFGSVPLWARSFVSSTDPKGLTGYIIHDVLCDLHTLNFDDTNNILIEILKFNKVNWFSRKIIWCAVQWGGAKAWKIGGNFVDNEKKYSKITFYHKG
jgi:hypothetical protein